MLRESTKPKVGNSQQGTPRGRATVPTTRMNGELGVRGLSGPSDRRAVPAPYRTFSAPKFDFVSIALCVLILLSLYVFVL